MTTSATNAQCDDTLPASTRRASLTRRTLLGAGAAALIVAPAAARSHARPGVQPEPDDALPADYPSTPTARARDIVGASHGNSDRVRELLAEDPSLARASYDWGFGDWETAIGAASHTGRRDIAETLIASGARPTLFSFAMLDQVEVVRAYCQANPGIQGLPGPHGITLLAHARAGKAARVVEYLQQLGGADEQPISLATADADIDRYCGDYSFGPAADDQWLVARSSRGDLTIRRTGQSPRRLHRIAEHTFSPAGAAHVTVTFQTAPTSAAGVIVRGAGRTVEARRVG